MLTKDDWNESVSWYTVSVNILSCFSVIFLLPPLLRLLRVIGKRTVSLVFKQNFNEYVEKGRIVRHRMKDIVI